MGSVAQPSRLFEPLQIGSHKLSSRVVMAPLTRFRADKDHVQLPFVREYYSQRACVPGTLLISEATFISPRASGYHNVPGIWSDAQIAAWKDVVAGVHAAGGVIFLQLWALGRTADAGVKAEEGTGPLVGASDVPMGADAPRPTPLAEDEIRAYIADYAQAARNAVRGAGFDGVEIHGANGYLVDQFTQDVTNTRTDGWGGSVEKRARFGIEVCQAVVDAVGADKTGIRLSPWSTFQGMKMADPVPQFSYLLQELKKLRLAYVHLVESRISGNADVEATEKIDPFVDIWAGTSPVLVAGGFRAKSAREAVDQQYKDKDVAVVFGRYFISTPDLVFRLQKGIELAPYNRDRFYKPESKEGYIDYAFSEEWQKEHSNL